MTEIDSDISISVARLTGWDSKTFSIASLEGGGNNRAFKLVRDKETYFLKQYFRDAVDIRNRGLNEYQFLTALWSEGIRNISRPFYYSDEDGIGLYGFLDGSPLPTPISKDDVSKASDFFVSINANRNAEAFYSLRPASEACFSLTSHLSTIQSRVERLKNISSDSEIDMAAKAFVAETLLPKWGSLNGGEQSFSKEQLDAEIPNKEKCLSPSDFGFHNALQIAKQLYFFDFEYAGWDDPAKMVCDFFNQPKFPAPLSELSSFTKRTAECLEIDASILLRRVKFLLPHYGVKWCTIALNDFLPIGNRRRAFANPSLETERKTVQLQKAKHILSRDFDSLLGA